MTFFDHYNQFKWGETASLIISATGSDVRRALLNAGHGTIEDFAALLSPAAEPYLEEMAQVSAALTRKRFGNTVGMYIPLYLSNECQNICTYCGFSYNNKIPRLTLGPEQILAEVKTIKSLGYDHVLLVTGEANKTVGVDYLANAIELVRPHFSQISIEVQPLEEEGYQKLIEHGLYGVLVYQETYDQESYKEFHPKGKKSNFRYRLETPDRLGRAGVHKIGLGALMGLSEWRTDAWFVALHLQYLEKKYWQTKYSISFPRLRPAEGIIDPKVVTTERNLLQLICAFRIFNENVELSLSTRESEYFRDNIVQLGVTSLSAGSKTEPGGYTMKSKALEQFEISDDRSPAEIAAMLKTKGLEPVWKDWERAYG